MADVLGAMCNDVLCCGYMVAVAAAVALALAGVTVVEAEAMK